MIINGFREFVRTVAAEGAVLLKNENVLPIVNEKAAVFGRCQIDYYKSGTGSGGAVNSVYVSDILSAFRENPRIIVDEEIAHMYEELTQKYPLNHTNRFEADFTDMEFDVPEKAIAESAKRNDKAVIVIGRVAGEAYDNENVKGSFLLTDNERRLIKNVGKHYKKFAVLLNTGNIIDMRWVDELDVPCVMYIWQGGEEGGRACADVVSGIVNPCGKLGDTIARTYEDYPSSPGFDGESEIIYSEDIFVGYRYFETFAKDKVLYPFGFGMSYTDFSIRALSMMHRDTKVELEADVYNIGKTAGKTVVQVYMEPPCGVLGRASRELIAFAKTDVIAPGESEKIRLSVDLKSFAAFDDMGKVANKSAWVLEKGIYKFYVGSDVRNAAWSYFCVLNENIVVKQSESCMSPVKPFERLINSNATKGHEIVVGNIDAQIKSAPEEFSNNGFCGNMGDAVQKGKLKEFIAQLTNEELAALSRGEGMLSPKVTQGTASCFGGVTPSLLKKGIPEACTSDGPSGIRMDNGEAATSMPGGAALACTWDTKIIEQLYEYEGKELKANNIDMLLGPGMNIHRNPLCGRNFEYYSEDPLLTGMIAAAAVRGIDRGGAMGVIKHFACNNREYNRYNANAVVSERALREIYLKPFEIAVKTSPVTGIMTSYNPINGYQSASNTDLADTVLRGDWGYDGFVMTDWWPQMNRFVGDKPSSRYLAAMAKSHNDVFMVVSNFRAGDWEDDILTSLESGELTKAHLQRNAYSVLNAISRMNCFERKYGFKAPSDKICSDWFDSETKEREYPTRKCIIPESGTRNKTHLLVDMLNIEGDGVSRCYSITAKPGDEALFTLVGERSGAGELTLSLEAKGEPLAQLAVFVEYNSKTYSYSLRGGETLTTKPEKMKVKTGWHEMKIVFSNANMADIVFHGMEIKYVK